MSAKTIPEQKSENWLTYIKESSSHAAREFLLSNLTRAGEDYKKRLDGLYWLIIFRLVNISRVSCSIKKSNNLNEAKYYFRKAQEMIESNPQEEYKKALFKKMGIAFKNLEYWSDIEELLAVAAPESY